MLTQQKQTVAVGLSIERIDGIPKVTGRALYTRDIKLPHMLYAKIKRSNHPFARIINVNCSKAQELNGVKTFVVGKDFAPMSNEDTPPLARDRVQYLGQAVVAVAADNLQIAERAAELVEIEYEPLPALLEPMLSMSAGSPILSPGLNNFRNVGNYLHIIKGNVNDGFSKADLIIENEFSTVAESQFQMEPLSFLARPDTDGGVTLWATSSGTSKVKYEVSSYLRLDPRKVRVLITFLGGWFGSKEENHLSAVCAALALKSKRPVKLELTRAETMTASGVRHPSIISIKDGISRGGVIIARAIRATYDGGAYGSLGNLMVKNAVMTASNVYSIPNFEVEVYRVYTTRVPGSAKRAPLGFQMAFAIESQMDSVARRLNLDPVDFRLRHVLRNGELNSMGEETIGMSYEVALSKVAKEIGWKASEPPLEYPWKKGKGIALAAKWGYSAPNQASVRVNADGSIDVFAPIIENGQGTYTGILQLVAEEFRIPVEMVNIASLIEGSSSEWGIGTGARASQQMANLGPAVIAACKEAKRSIAHVAASALGVDETDIAVEDGKIYSLSKPSRQMKIKDVFIQGSILLGSPIYVPPHGHGEFRGSSTYLKKIGHFDPKNGQLEDGRASPYYITVAQAIELAVNIETGNVKVMKVAAAMDVGKAINPELVRGQIEGSVMMGLNAALSEELIFSEGSIVNANLADYKLLTSLDTPEILPFILETPYEQGPWGARGAGEASILPTAAAVRNAVYDATGKWINSLPITPEKIVES
ncbi:MAG: xanthine dehydrogenase family protein molybdopterin-binding subunit [Thaumarchaeota archaeon]|nr:xanthine dehydrogenase family protein molybdopterin-binding subunit [Nitrososphaerota archaeon]